MSQLTKALLEENEIPFEEAISRYRHKAGPFTIIDVKQENIMGNLYNVALVQAADGWLYKVLDNRKNIYRNQIEFYPAGAYGKFGPEACRQWLKELGLRITLK